MELGKRPEIPPGALYMPILKSLARLGPMHGYGIAQYVQRISDDVLQVEEGSLYPALQRMLIKGWVVAEWKAVERGNRDAACRQFGNAALLKEDSRSEE